ncbi:hypothetical protein M406DRAFT_324867 [Cryphonectria parasitica EP155]|uniref:Uncharacterized protein n=1 Tax=Cryphonectria parasitica (strain ATCC 38755 / EP155) TaxID=660469 RepID=A0A9P5CJ79_CRYP1|nr:uncharacterized protein M406DRAFT_324867 [Cryphonectria parasitica EP155]KAF3759977.1 hypothetical protein M406DRAFT_324867 [Cryphonectria parasitica EP155]
MRPETLIVVLAAVASARPVPTPSSVHDVIVPRELQYADIKAASGTPTWRHWPKNSYDRDEDHYSRHRRGEPHFHDGRMPHDHHGSHRHDERHPDLPHDHHKGGPQSDVVDNVLDFISHHARSVPEVSSRIMNGIVEFLSHETRAYLDETDDDAAAFHRDHHSPVIFKKTLN